MNRVRVNVYIDRDHARRIAELSHLKRRSKSSIVATALTQFLTPDDAEKPLTLLVRRIERVVRQMDRLERDQVILLETLALFIRQQLSVAAPVPEASQAIVRTQGRVRFGHFVEQVTQHLQRGGSLAKKIYDEIEAAEQAAQAARDSGSAEEPS